MKKWDELLIKFGIEELDFDISFEKIYSLLQKNSKLITKKLTLIEHPLDDFNVSLKVTVVKENVINVINYYFIAYLEDELLFQEAINEFLKKYDYYLIGIDELGIEKLIINHLHRQRLMISVAESCTGGMLMSRLIGVPGASNVIESSYLTYSEKAKETILGVKHLTIFNSGVVSAEVAEEMAVGVKKLSGADIGVAITGYAGGNDYNLDDGLFYFSIIFHDYIHLEKGIVKGTRNETRFGQSTYVFWRLYQLLKVLR